MPHRIFTPGERLMVDVTVLPEEPHVAPIKPHVPPIDLHPRVSRMVDVRVESKAFITTFWVPAAEVADKGAGDGSAVLRATVALDRDAFGDLIPINIRGLRERFVVPRACVTQDAAAVTARQVAATAEETERERAELRRLIEKHGLPETAR